MKRGFFLLKMLSFWTFHAYVSSSAWLYVRLYYIEDLKKCMETRKYETEVLIVMEGNWSWSILCGWSLIFTRHHCLIKWKLVDGRCWGSEGNFQHGSTIIHKRKITTRSKLLLTFFPKDFRFFYCVHRTDESLLICVNTLLYREAQSKRINQRKSDVWRLYESCHNRRHLRRSPFCLLLSLRSADIKMSTKF